MIGVEVRGNNIEGAIVRLKRQVSKDGVLSAIKHRAQFPKPSTRRKAKDRRATNRRKKSEERRQRNR